MRDIEIPFAELILIAGTRAALGLGIGLLIADSLTAQQRRAAGWTLAAVGVLTTIPLAADVLSRKRDVARTQAPRVSVGDLA
jgi:hypothetical protein